MSGPLLAPETEERDIIIAVLDWRGVLVEVRYEPTWLSGDFGYAHLELETIEPARAPLPVTETGYRSHFLSPGLVDDAGGPAAYALAWLTAAARRKGWAEQESAARQYSLF